jgi:hypothetical protein
MGTTPHNLTIGHLLVDLSSLTGDREAPHAATASQ